MPSKEMDIFSKGQYPAPKQAEVELPSAVPASTKVFSSVPVPFRPLQSSTLLRAQVGFV